MSRTILAVAVVCALAACGGKGHRTKAGSTNHSEATRSTPTQSTQQKKKATRPDTTRAKNPLTNN